MIKRLVLCIVALVSVLGGLATGASAAPGEAAAVGNANRKAVSPNCYVEPPHDGKLYCYNKINKPLFEHRSYSSKVRDFLDTSWSVFNCWGRGDNHPGGNNVWYWTQGDRQGLWGNLPAFDVHTSYDPMLGHRQC